jgi:hypothetical protein
MIPARPSNHLRTLHERDAALLPRYGADEVAVSLRPSPRSIATGLRPRPAGAPQTSAMSDNEHALRLAQMESYASQSAGNTMHTFNYDPCRSR